MRLLFVHQNFPGQYKHLAPAMQARGDEVVALSIQEVPDPSIRVLRTTPKHSTSAGHPWARDFETKIIRAEATLQTARALRDEGFVPDVIVAHPGWGDTLFLKQVWPEARFGVYCEYYYGSDGGDQGFDPEFPFLSDPLEAKCVASLRNLPQRLNFELANRCISPTYFQADTYPARYRGLIDVVHDGIDTDFLCPDPNARLSLGSGVEISASDEVITFVARNLEPYRGYHIFMRALPDLLARRPNARVVIVGGDKVSYGAEAPDGTTWKSIFLAEVLGKLDMSRVHFVGSIPYPVFIALLRISRLHVYLTYPFVLSWSLLEAMSLGAPILASDTAPLREVITDGETGRLFPFFDPQALTDTACAMLEDDGLRERLRTNARAFVQAHYDLQSVCLPRQIEWIDNLFRSEPILP